MSQDFAVKYSPVVDERFKLGAQTAAVVNQDYDFVGVQTVNVYSVSTAQMNDYQKSGSNRYGNPSELEASKQELTLKKDRSFTFTIDRANYNDQMMVTEAGKALARQLDEVAIPEIDIYRLEKIVRGAGTTSTATAISKQNAYSAFLDAQEALSDNKVPLQGRVCYCTNAYYKFLKQDDSFIKAGDVSQDMLVRGSVGMVDGVNIVPEPKSYFLDGVDFVITHPVACCSPVKLATYKIHEDAPGISGWLVEGRLYYDAFILDNKKKAIYVHINKTLPAVPSAPPASEEQ